MASTAQRTSADGRERALIALTMAVVAFAVGAFAYAQVRKQEESPVAGIRVGGVVMPGCDCPRETIELSFTLSETQELAASVVDRRGELVRTLLDGEVRERGRVTLGWDATGDSGRAVRTGDYRLRLDLTEPPRTVVIPTEIRVER